MYLTSKHLCVFIFYEIKQEIIRPPKQNSRVTSAAMIFLKLVFDNVFYKQKSATSPLYLTVK